jgi:hypothetical protein
MKEHAFVSVINIMKPTKRTHKVIYCDCGESVFGKSSMEAIRKEMDHLREVHPDRYDEMLEDLTPHQIKHWMLRQVYNAEDKIRE